MNAGVFVLGLAILVAGILAAGYTVYENKVYFFGTYSETSATRPYENVAIPLIIIGLVIMVIGIATPTTKTTTKESYEESPRRKTKVVETED